MGALERLFELNQETDKKEETDEKKEETDKKKDKLVSAGEDIWFYAIFIWRIAYSQTIRYHLTVLQHGGHLPLPIMLAKSTYKNYIGPLVSKSTTTAENINSCEDEDEEPDEADLEGLHVDVDKNTNAAVFLRWLRLQIAQIFALYVTSSFCSRVPTSGDSPILNISLLAVKPAPQTVDSWDRLVETFCKLDSRLRSDDIVNFIKQHAKTGCISGQHHDLYQKFTSTEIKHGGNIHCEAAMASLSLYYREALVSDDVSRILENTDKDLITVSKLCCPVCWDLLDELRGVSDNIMKVRGRHSTISAVHLPPWLPRDVMNAMVFKYQGYLHKELDKMVGYIMNDPSSQTGSSSRNHVHSRSVESVAESVSGLSEAGSDQSSALDDLGQP